MIQGHGTSSQWDPHFQNWSRLYPDATQAPQEVCGRMTAALSPDDLYSNDPSETLMFDAIDRIYGLTGKDFNWP